MLRSGVTGRDTRPSLKEITHRAIAEAMNHMTMEAPELERLDAERRAEVRRGQS